MRLNFIFFISFFLFQFNIYSNNDKYRLSINDDPATTITVAWNQISGSNPQVYYGTTDHGTNYTQYNNTKSVDRSIFFKGMNNQFAKLTGLSPNTNYYFVIHDSQGTSQRFWFKTAPDDLSRLSFIAGGDSRNNRTPRQNANRLVAKLKPHAVFFGGDMTDDDTSDEWQDWFDDWQLTTASDGRMFPIVAARGNHEYDATTVYNLFDTPNQSSYYAITFGNNLIRSYTLNTEISVSGNQLTWLQNDLNNSSSAIWKMAQYHKPMRPHTGSKSEGNSHYSAWAQLFYNTGVNLVVDCDSHVAKTTYPIKPSNGPNSDEGFEIDNDFGTVYTGEGTWGAPLRSNNDDKTWTRSSGSFNQFKLLFVDENKIELRTIKVDNAGSVGENPNNNQFQLPNNLDVFSPPTGAVVTILNASNNCADAGTVCDDGDPNTINDIEDGFCNCNGIAQSGTLNVVVAEDAEEGENGTIYLDSSDLELVFDSFDGQNNQTVGLRFTDITLPTNATITNAYIQFTVDETSSGTTNLNIDGHYSGNSSFFSLTNNNITSRTLTSSQLTVSWNNVPSWNSIGESGFNQRTPDLSAIVEDILSHPNWLSSNAMSFIISGSGARTAESIDGNTAGAPRLIIDYSISSTTNCDAPSNLSISNISTDSATFSWGSESNSNDGYDWVIMPTGTEPDSATAVSAGSTSFSTNSIQISNLSEANSYDAYVRSNCEIGNSSDWSSVLSFSTLENCDTPANLSVSNISTNSVSFSWGTVSNSNNGYEWLVMPNGNAPDPTTASSTGSTSFGNNTTQVSGLSEATSYDAYVRSNCGSGNLSTWSAVLNFSTLVNCNAPANLSVSSISTNSASLSWDSVSTANNGYEWLVMPNGNAPDPTTATDTGSTSFGTNSTQISNLSEASSYDAYVRSNCATGNLSSWSAVLSFSTLENCDAPANLSVSSISTNSASLSWDSVSNANNGYEYMIMLDGNTPDPSNAVASGNISFGTSTTQVSGLSTDTNYDAYIASNCIQNTPMSWSSALSFSTLSDNSSCPTLGTPCDDGNSNTINDLEDGNCNCIGITLAVIEQKIAIGKTTVGGDALVDFGEELRGLVIAPVSDVTTMNASPGTIAFDGATGSFRYLDDSGNWSTVVIGGENGGAYEGVDIFQNLIGANTSSTEGVLILGEDDGETKALVLPKLANGNLKFNNPVPGLIYYDTVLKAVMVYNGNGWTRF